MNRMKKPINEVHSENTENFENSGSDIFLNLSAKLARGNP